MKTFFTLLLLAAIPSVFACWAISQPIMLDLEGRGGAGLVCVDAFGNRPTSGAGLRIAIRRIKLYAAIVKTNTETGEQVWEDVTVEYGAPTGSNYALYIYRISSGTGDKTITAHLETRQITPAEVTDGVAGVSLTTVGTPAELFADYPYDDQLLLSLYPRSVGDTIKLVDTNIRSLYHQMILTRSGTTNTTTKKTVNFSGCSLSVPGTVLPLTPTLTVAPATVTAYTYSVISNVYKAEAAWGESVTITTPQSSLDGEAETTTYAAPITAARLTVTDADGGTETFSAAALQTGSKLPVWGRYGINPWGIVAGEQLKFDLVLSADGVNSNQAVDSLTVVTRPAVSSVTVTVTGDNRPER